MCEIDHRPCTADTEEGALWNIASAIDIYINAAVARIRLLAQGFVEIPDAEAAEAAGPYGDRKAINWWMKKYSWHMWLRSKLEDVVEEKVPIGLLYANRYLRNNFGEARRPPVGSLERYWSTWMLMEHWRRTRDYVNQQGRRRKKKRDSHEVMRENTEFDFLKFDGRYKSIEQEEAEALLRVPIMTRFKNWMGSFFSADIPSEYESSFESSSTDVAALTVTQRRERDRKKALQQYVQDGMH